MAVIQFGGDTPLLDARRREEMLWAQLQAIDRVSELLTVVAQANSSRDARSALMQAWDMTELQAQIVLEMPVQRFSRMEREKVAQELMAVQEFVAAQIGREHR